jgi:hypothetical protein
VEDALRLPDRQRVRSGGMWVTRSLGGPKKVRVGGCRGPVAAAHDRPPRGAVARPVQQHDPQPPDPVPGDTDGASFLAASRTTRSRGSGSSASSRSAGCSPRSPSHPEAWASSSWRTSAGSSLRAEVTRPCRRRTSTRRRQPACWSSWRYVRHPDPDRRGHAHDLVDEEQLASPASVTLPAS